jgi:hypothetical protein
MTHAPATPATRFFCFDAAMNRDSERIPRRLPRGMVDI